eukprot:Tbor_TRINITY_DN2581_c0_g2::TRINITY_DN2581_c0_g2_i1::g.559::m.559
MSVAIVGMRYTFSALFIGAGFAHFHPKLLPVYCDIIPPYIMEYSPISRKDLVYFTGVCEIAGGCGILFPQTCKLAGVMLIIFMIAVFPANIYAAENPDKGKWASAPLSRRVPMQVFLICWCAFVTLVNPV